MNRKVSEYKKLLAGVLLEVQDQTFKFLKQLEKNSVSEDDLKGMVNFASNRMNLVFDGNFESLNMDEKTYEVEKNNLLEKIKEVNTNKTYSTGFYFKKTIY